MIFFGIHCWYSHWQATSIPVIGLLINRFCVAIEPRRGGDDRFTRMIMSFPLANPPSSVARFNEAEAHAPRIRSGETSRASIDECFNEAEAHAPRIHGLQHPPVLLDRRASMRPRRMRLGYNRLSRSWAELMAMASMRPRRMRLGYIFEIFLKPSLEAPASMRPRRMRLGYRRRPHRSPPCAGGFNEAEAHAPRIHFAQKSCAKGFGQASMRPRRMRLGYSRTGGRCNLCPRPLQ